MNEAAVMKVYEYLCASRSGLGALWARMKKSILLRGVSGLNR